MNEAAIERARFNMLQQQIRPWKPVSDRVLETLRSIPREQFVPKAFRDLAFADCALPVGDMQMCPPRLEAGILHALAIQPGDLILEVGTGPGYLTACLARLGSRVTSIDRFGDQQRLAEQRLGALGIDNVTFLLSDSLDTLPTGPYDAILVNGSLPQRNQSLERLLGPGGRLWAVIGIGPCMEACLIRRQDGDEWRMESLFETQLPPLIPVDWRPGFQF